MNYTEWFGSRAIKGLAMVLLAAVATSLSAAEQHAGFAKVRFVVGNATVTKPGGQSQKLVKEMVLHTGDTITTDDASHVDLYLANNNGHIQVSKNSVLKLDSLTYSYSGVELVHNTQLDLQKGVLYGDVRKMSTASKYEIKTKVGVAGIRGTRYRITAEGDVTVTEGAVIVSVKQADGTFKTYTVHKGETLIASTGEVRPATDAEMDDTNRGTLDAPSHGGYVNDVDPTTRRFFTDSAQETFVSPIKPE